MTGSWLRGLTLLFECLIKPHFFLRVKHWLMATNGSPSLPRSAFSDPQMETWSRLPVNYTPGSLELFGSPSDLIRLYCDHLPVPTQKLVQSSLRALQRPSLINQIINRPFLWAGRERKSGWSGFKEWVHSSLWWRWGQQGAGPEGAGHYLHWCIDPDPGAVNYHLQEKHENFKCSCLALLISAGSVEVIDWVTLGKHGVLLNPSWNPWCFHIKYKARCMCQNETLLGAVFAIINIYN